MEVTYNISINESYYRTLIDRYYRQRPFVFRLPIQFGILAFAGATAFGFLIIAPLGTRVVFALVIAASIFFGGVAVTKWAIFQRFRYRADFGAIASITMSEAGLRASGPHVQGKWDWAAYPSAVRYPRFVNCGRRSRVVRCIPSTPKNITAFGLEFNYN